ncbi:MAG TPA: carboxypeptidase-like regulatory domain-containing protein [Solirubrobacter sp.]|nr:carboxypeptidase-like regulatory domain-containing protein [Solirubrobacter sp.]
MRTPRSEAGFALIEVIVSAAVLAIVALAVLSGIDAANGASARERARAVAASLAEQDQERLRAMPIDMLKNPPQAPDAVVDGVTYKIKSEARWITDDVDGSPACGAGSGSENQVEYLQIKTTVTSEIVGARIPAVTIDSLVSPTTKWAEGHGTLGVKVIDRTGAGVQGITVMPSSAGFTPTAQVTNEQGCVLWKSVPIGTYTITLNTPGYIDSKGNQVSKTIQNVVAKKVSFPTIRYDRPARANVSVTTHIPGTAWSAAGSKPSKAFDVSATNGAEVGFFRTFTPATPSNAFQVDQLFPFATNSYSFFSGRCGWADPEDYNANYYSVTNPAAGLLADPDAVKDVSVRQPPFNIRITRRYGGTSFTDGQVTVYARLQQPDESTEECAQPVYQLTTAAWPSSGWGSVKSGHWVSQERPAFEPGMPFGKYELCLVYGTRGSLVSTLYDNTAPNGRQTTVDISQADSTWSTSQKCWQ